MDAWPQLGVGAVLTAAGWLVTRRWSGARWQRPAALLLDALWPALGYALALAVTARPILAGLGVLALASGLMLGDQGKRAALREPIVFSDMDEFLQLFRHPQLYLPFVGTGLVAACLLGAGTVLVALFVIEPAAWPWTPWPGLLLIAGVVAASFALVRAPLLDAVARALKRFRLSGDPTTDAASLGLLAMLFTQGMIARAERPARRNAAGRPPAPATIGVAGERRPIVLVQSESFFDLRRLHPAVPRDLLPAFDACCRTSLQFGQLTVPGWGANTMRTEFAALTGITEAQLGFDRFNPYHAFARAPVTSLAWRLRALGYRTVCVHPFDRKFFRRDIAMANLGFDAFLGPEAFVGAARNGLYVTDLAVGQRIAALLDTDGPQQFVFAITMENHGPWSDAPTAAVDLDPDRFDPTQNAALDQYMKGLRNADSMVALLTERLVGHDPALLGFYGDHLPSLPATFDALGFTDSRTDYMLWRSGGGATPTRRDLAAHDLPQAVLAAAGLAS